MNHNRYRRHSKEGLDCPHCGTKNTLVRSRVRLLERIRRLFSRKRPYRCHACLFRLWVDSRHPPVAGSQKLEARS